VTLTLAVGSGDSDANELSGTLQSGSTMWIGNEAAIGSIAAARFDGVAIPRGAIVTSAHLEVRSAVTNWTRTAFEYAAEASGQSAPFGPGALPSQRPLSAPRVNHLTDAQWVSGTWYTLEEIAPIVQEVVNRADWASGNALLILMRGTGVVTILDDDAGAGPVTATFQIAATGDDVNQDGTSLTTNGSPMWVGTGSSATSSYVGLRFAGVTIPRNATITSARLEVNAASTAWIALGFEVGIESAASSAPFSAASLPSQRTLLAPRVAHSSNQQWTADAWIDLGDIAPTVQALVARADWNPGNALGLILRGTTGAWARKPIKSFETTATMAPRLVVTYTLP
jgi:type IV pilus assembly protein PilY1